MKLNKILLNASNLHVGGGVQVATSVIGELTKVAHLPPGLTIWASATVDANLRGLGLDLSNIPSYEVIDSKGFKLAFSSLSRRLNEFNAIFTVFGPLYAIGFTGVNITGFAQPWIIYPDNELVKSLRWFKRLSSKAKFILQSIMFSRADHLVVELDHVRRGLVEKLGIDKDRIHLVSNCLSNTYVKPESWQIFSNPKIECDLRLGFIGRNYLHKNTSIFCYIEAELRLTYGINAKFVVTFTDAEWQACPAVFRQVSVNVGSLSVAQCPNFYKSLDAVVFPSLLECFSATPLETMAMEIPLFASDRPFNRDVCGDHAHYFDPMAPETAARAIANVFTNGGPNPAALRAAREHAINFSNPKERAEKYLALLMQCSK